MTPRQNPCVECLTPTANRSLVCDKCAADYADPPACDCVPCRSGMTHIMPCLKEAARG